MIPQGVNPLTAQVPDQTGDRTCVEFLSIGQNAKIGNSKEDYGEFLNSDLFVYSF